MAARSLYPDTVACKNVSICNETCHSEFGCSHLAYVELVDDILPHGFKGLMIAVLLTNTMCSLTSVFNSTQTIFTMDVYKKIRPKATQKELFYAGRLFTLTMALTSVAWVSKFSKNAEIFQTIQEMTSYFAPAISAIFVLSLFWTRTTEPGAFWGLITGNLVGIFRLILDLALDKPNCLQELLPEVSFTWYIWFMDINYLHFGLIVFQVSFCTCILVSLITPPIPEEKQRKLNFWSHRCSEVPQIEATAAISNLDPALNESQLISS